MRIVITEPDGLTKVKTIMSFAELRKEFPRTSFTRPFTQRQLDVASGGAALISTEVERPQLAFGESATSDDERQTDGTWLQVWDVTSITLGAAKTQIADLAISIYWDKVDLGKNPPTLTETTTAIADPLTLLTNRRDRFRAKLNDVRTRIIGATTIAEARAILAELEALL